MTWEVCQLGAARLDATTRAPLTQAIKPAAEVENNEPFGDLPTYSALGVTAMPAAANAAGACEGLVAQEAAGLPGVIVGMRDLRAAGVVAELAAGETCLHSTGEGFESRVFCKDKIVAIIIGDDTAFILDKTAQTATLSIGGSAIQVSADGILISAADGSFLQLGEGEARLVASKVLLGQGGLSGASYAPAAMIPNPATPAVAAPSLGVLVPGVPI